jgi:hypothetical protein
LPIGFAAHLHFAAQDFVHVGLVFLAARAVPCKDVGIDAEADKFLDWPVVRVADDF